MIDSDPWYLSLDICFCVFFTLNSCVLFHPLFFHVSSLIPSFLPYVVCAVCHSSWLQSKGVVNSRLPHTHVMDAGSLDLFKQNDMGNMQTKVYLKHRYQLDLCSNVTVTDSNISA